MGYMQITWPSLVAQIVNSPPAIQETLVQSLGREDPLEKGMATPVFLPGEFHGRRRLMGYSPWGLRGLDKTRGGTRDFFVPQ